MPSYANGWENDVLHLMKTIKSWYGGMGSFNDLYISKEGGDAVAEAEEQAVNHRLKELRTELYTKIENFLETPEALG